MEKINWLNYKGEANPILEAFRTIRTNLLNTHLDSGIKLIEFTGASAVKQKSEVVAGIAIVLAQAGKKVLIIDGNISEPVQHILFGLSNQGITDCIVTGIDLHNKIQHCVEQEHLDILTSGNTLQGNGEILLEEEMQQFLCVAREEYDYILLDMPSLETVADAATISHCVDGVVLIMNSRNDKVNELRDAKRKLEKAGATLLGCILNKA